ncbi:MAG: integration host factor, actinobacterial type [Propionicimonas sp.]|uniref:integration host factor, actinobacterial type n=1 Tax=Propionicimonas sp. TaxID=1955623 RepID=UPI002B1F9029|nr:integration host factor, actinobacterial type [Propionicimonas sp.]MEA4943127.1 integration host factor, actinobacterial type [Propionicimonas sp.]MEA5054421.1 integration host factor, actinobacterial type [Propionicimonas sp.]MEA5118938.1 integration host factor, actinobacterial type [Propionicimonas sp.]
MENLVTIPQLTTEQLEAARAAATMARRQRAELKNKVRDGELSLAQALDAASQDDVLAHVKVVDLLKSLPRVGEKRAAVVMEKLEIAPNRRIRGLGRHQLAGLRSEFGER